MQDVKPKWLDAGLVLVCTRCSERISEEDPDIAERIGDFRLRDWLKRRFKQDGRWGKLRVISTSCMDVCARGKVTVCIDPKGDGATPEIFVVDPLEEREAVFDRIVAKLG